MMTRRHFLSLAAAGTTALAAARLKADGPGVGAMMPTKGKIGDKPLPTNSVSPGEKYRPAFRLGLGGVAIGNAFAPATDAQAEATLEAAWEAGVRYFDTSPWYGLGLSERRFGHFLHNHKPEEYVLSTKVGRLLTAAVEPPQTMWQQPAPFSYRYDYTAEGVRRSIEDSLQRLGVSSK